MEDEKIKKITKKLIKIAKSATKLYYKHSFYEVSSRHKFEGDDVTNRDIETQNYVLKKCKKILPDFSFIGEEQKISNNNKYAFVVDPIDGTCNFKHNIPLYGTQLCLKEDDKILISVLIVPALKDVYYANKFGAYRNGKRIFVSDTKDLCDSIVLFGDFSASYMKDQQKYIQYLSENCKRLRLIGTSCVSSAYLADGKCDLYIIFSKNAWDIAPGQFLIEMAGGCMYANKQYGFYAFANKTLLEKFDSAISKADLKL